MKGCFILQGQYVKLGHTLALYLKNQKIVDQFCGYIFTPLAQKTISEQKDINYDQILVDHEIHELYKKEPLDIEYLKYFEETYGPPHLWHYLYIDRKLMMSIGPKEETTAEIDPLYSHEDLMRIFQIRAKAIEKFLKENKPDFILFFAIGSLAHLLLFHIAKKMGIKTFDFDFPRIGNLLSVSEDYNTLTGVEELFSKYRNNTLEEDAATKKQAENFLQHFKEKNSLNLEYLAEDIKVNPISSSSIGPRNIIRTCHYLYTLTLSYLRTKNLYIYGNSYQNPLRFIAHKIKIRYRKWHGLNDLYHKPQDEDYAFFPLHYEPELATLLLSPFYFDQTALIRIIARSLPLHFKLYVKEHPAMLYKRSRRFYKTLLKIPNVRLIDPRANNGDLLNKTKLVTVITGTMGWEACLKGKPVISFGEVFFNCLSGVKRVRNIETLPQVVKEQLEKFEFNQQEIHQMVLAIFKDSVPVNFAGLWFEESIDKLLGDPGVQLLGKKLGDKILSI